jgi:hypothetical protein
MNFGNLDINTILGRYADGGDADGNDDDFDQVAQQAPPGVMAQGISEAFRSDRTPPFPNMLGQMWSNSDPNTRAGILNQLIAAAGPAILSGALSRGTGMSGGLSGLLAGLLGGQSAQTAARQVTPEQASQVPPAAVEELAREAQQQDPDIISRVSNLAAENPALAKGLGAIAMGIALKHLAGQKRGGLF